MKQKIKGSILAYSLIVLAMMFAIVGSISAVSILEKKSARSSNSSAQSFQVADSAVQIAIKKLNDAYKANENSTIKDAFPSCSGSAVVNSQLDAQKLYKLTFYDASDNPLPNCNKQLKEVESIKSIGTYENTVRAVKVAVAAAPTLLPHDNTNCTWHGPYADWQGLEYTCPDGEWVAGFKQDVNNGSRENWYLRCCKVF